MKGIKCIGPVFGISGYSQWSRRYIVSLIKSDIPVTVSPILFETDNEEVDLGADGDLIKKHCNLKINYDTAIAWLTPELAVRFLSQEPSGIKKVSMSLWETDKLPDYWCKCLATMDKVWVSGRWNQEVYQSSFKNFTKTNPNFSKLDSIKVSVVPYPLQHSSDRPVTSVKIEGLKEACRGRFAFYSISQWNARKNFEGLLTAYWNSFSKEDKVVLVLKTYFRDNSASDRLAIERRVNEIREQRSDKDNLPEILLVHGRLTDSQMNYIHEVGDCYVSTARGEGLGLGILEAATFKKPLIVTGYGDHLHYLPDHYKYSSEFEMQSVAGMEKFYTWYDASQSWADPKIHSVGDMMLKIYKNREEALVTVKEVSEKLKEFTEERTVKAIKDALC